MYEFSASGPRGGDGSAVHVELLRDVPHAVLGRGPADERARGTLLVRRSLEKRQIRRARWPWNSGDSLDHLDELLERGLMADISGHTRLGPGEDGRFRFPPAQHDHEDIR